MITSYELPRRGPFGVGLLIHNIIWLIWPVEYYLRPEISIHSPDLFMRAIAYFFKLDSPPLNCFPSLHVTYAFLTYYALHVFKPRIAPPFFLLAILISLSTLTFKQHFIADAVVGFVLAVILKSIFFPSR